MTSPQVRVDVEALIDQRRWSELKAAAEDVNKFETPALGI